ncbi:AAA family ATPase [Paraburkholderia dioscoreae]|uniref:AAA family ATPase n=1 Tax=Paraburkholderia dioscoreae TaxID=2604047 RepID=UPI001E470493|nr:AAA family ATPase [Paraburkholderia dioscoreae]
MKEAENFAARKPQTNIVPDRGVASRETRVQPLLPPEQRAEPLREGIMLSRASAVAPVAIRWLWQDWLPEGKLSLLAGSPGTGKTTLAVAMAAIVSAGGAWPDGPRCASRGNVLFWSGEDDVADTLVPRLMAAGADLDRVYFVRSRIDENDEVQPFDPAFDIPLLGERVEAMGGASLLIVDPIVSAVSGDAHRANDVRRDLQALVDMAARYGCAVLGISHFAKGTRGSSPAERVIGSGAFVALARMVLVAGKDEAEERRILARAKANITFDDGGIEYMLEQVDVNGIPASRVVWGGLIEGNAREILGDVEMLPGDDEKTEREEAADFLASLLVQGPVPVNSIKADATGAGYAWRTVERAKRDLGVEARKAGMKGGWMWAIPADADEDRRGETEGHETPHGGGLRHSRRPSAETRISMIGTPEERQISEVRHRTGSGGLHDYCVRSADDAAVGVNPDDAESEE